MTGVSAFASSSCRGLLSAGDLETSAHAVSIERAITTGGGRCVRGRTTRWGEAFKFGRRGGSLKRAPPGPPEKTLHVRGVKRIWVHDEVTVAWERPRHGIGEIASDLRHPAERLRLGSVA